MAKTDQLGTNERVQEKIQEIKRFAREAAVVSSDNGGEVEGLRDALRVLQMREMEFRQQLEEADRLRVELHQQANMRVEQGMERIEVVLYLCECMCVQCVRIPYA